MDLKKLFRQCLCTEQSISTCAVCLLCILIITLLTPILARNVPNILIIGTMAAFVICVLPRILYLRQRDKWVLIVLAAVMAVQVVYKLLGRSSAALYYYFNTVQFYFFLGAAIMTHSSLKKDQMLLVFGTILVTLLYNMGHNIVLFMIHGADDYINLFTAEKYTTNSMNTPYVSAIMLMTGIAWICAMRNKNKIFRIAAFAFAVFGFLFILIIAQRMISVILTVLMLGAIFLVGMKKRPLKKLSPKTRKIVILGTIAAVLLLVIFAIPILRLVRSMVSSDRLVNRINQIIRFLKTGDPEQAGGSLSARYRLMSTSWNTFTSSVWNFLIGAGDHRITNEIIGNHSLLLDELARYGFVFGLLSFYLLYCAMMATRSMCHMKPGTKLSRQVTVIFITLALRAVVGDILDASIGACLFIAIPLLLKLSRMPGPLFVLGSENTDKPDEKETER